MSDKNGGDAGTYYIKPDVTNDLLGTFIGNGGFDNPRLFWEAITQDLTSATTHETMKLICDGPWTELCVVDSDQGRSASTTGAGNRCNKNATSVVSIDYSLDFTIQKEEDKDNPDRIAQWQLDFLDCFANCKNIWMLDLCGKRDEHTVGIWMVGTITSFPETKPLADLITSDVTIEPAKVSPCTRNAGPIICDPTA